MENPPLSKHTYYNNQMCDALLVETLYWLPVTSQELHVYSKYYHHHYHNSNSEIPDFSLSDPLFVLNWLFMLFWGKSMMLSDNPEDFQIFKAV